MTIATRRAIPVLRLPRVLRGGPLIPVVVLGLIVVSGLLAPWITPHDAKAGILSTSLLPPAWEGNGTWSFLLGTDQQGRDILSRLIAGAQVSLFVGVAAVGISG